MIFWELFAVFFKIGAVTFGGGYAMIALIQHEVVSRGWLSAEQFANMVAVSQMTPGPLAVNTATYVGKSQAGIGGAILASIAIALPSVLFSIIVLLFFRKLRESSRFQGVIRGVRAAALGLIFSAVLFFAETSIFNGTLPLNPSDWSLWSGVRISIPSLIVFGILLAAAVFLKLKPLFIILLSLLFGVAFYLFPYLLRA